MKLTRAEIVGIKEQIYNAIRGFHRSVGIKPERIYLGGKQILMLRSLTQDEYYFITHRNEDAFFVMGLECFEVCEADHLHVTI